MMLYYLEPYLKEVETQVIEIDGNKILLEETVLYPGGGGQPPDRGWILCGGKKFSAQHLGDGWHIINGECYEKNVKVVLDWQFRYEMMKMHTAEHAFFRFLQNKGAVLGKANFGEYGVVVFRGNITKNDVLDAEKRVEDMIRRGREVRSFWVDRSKIKDIEKLRIRFDRIKGDRIRVVDIVGHDVTACKGIHVKDMSEIEDFAVVKFRDGKNKEVKFVVGNRARDSHYLFSLILRRMAWKYRIELDKMESHVENLTSEIEKLKYALKEVSQNIPFETFECSKLKLKYLLMHGGFRKIIVKRLLEGVNNGVDVAIYGDMQSNSFSCACKDTLIKSIVIQEMKNHGGKGGGRDNFVSGTVDDVKSFVNSLQKVICSSDIHLHGDENGS